MQISRIESLDYSSLHQILTSNKITDAEKVQFVKNNKTEITNILQTTFNITHAEFKAIMKNRPLVKFQPLRNSFKKRGDKKLLAIALGIDSSDVDDYIDNVIDELKKTYDLSFLPKDTLENIKTYIYRHRSKDDIVIFLEYELKNTKDIISMLYNTLEYHTGGIADYFIRPIHKMDNKTLVRIYNVIDKQLKIQKENGLISEEENTKIAKWALCQIYKIQNNNKFINAVKTYKVLSH